MAEQRRNPNVAKRLCAYSLLALMGLAGATAFVATLAAYPIQSAICAAAGAVALTTLWALAVLAEGGWR